MSQNGQTHFKNLSAFAARFLKCVWPFWDIMGETNHPKNRMNYLLMQISAYLCIKWEKIFHIQI